MKRFHVHVAVDDLAQSTRFYSALFGAAPAVEKADYVKWMLDDPRVNFAISARGQSPGVNHLGLQVDSDDELAALKTQHNAAALALFDEGETGCCYAHSNKHWLTDPRFASDESRAEHGELLSERTERWSMQYTTAEALERLAAARIPVAPVLSPQQVLEDPHVRAGGYLQEVEYPGLPRPATLVTPGAELSASPATIRSRAPTIGEHTDAILGELGFSAADIATLRARRIV